MFTPPQLRRRVTPAGGHGQGPWSRWRSTAAALALGVIGLSGAVAFQANPAFARPHDSDHEGRHVLLISVDGLHASDLSRWVAENPQLHLARLTRTGTTYANASASEPSDSFPGLLALVTGGTPKTTGVFYDNSYARNLWAPGTNCAGPAGADAVYDESIDKTLANGDIPLFTSIDPALLPLGKVNGKCVPIFPHNFLQTNTVFNVAHDAGLYTAWSDKHPAYELVNGPSGDGVDDLFTPEINNVANPTGTSVQATADYDAIKVRATLNEIAGKTADGKKRAPVPAIFGMNFQAVSVGEKLVDPVKSCLRNPTTTCDPGYVPGAYLPGTLAFTPQMTLAMTSVDTALGAMVRALRENDLLDSTEIIISAKHGQSPIDPAKLKKIGDPIATILKNAGIKVAHSTTDDIDLIWLADQKQAAAAAQALNADKAGANTARIDTIFADGPLATQFGDPLANPRTPDLIVQPIAGTIYTTSKAKVAEHGGFAADDTHVALLVVNGADERDGEDRGDGEDGGGRTIAAKVTTTQVAPSILAFLGLNPLSLKSVKLEGTHTLPR